MNLNEVQNLATQNVSDTQNTANPTKSMNFAPNSAAQKATNALARQNSKDLNGGSQENPNSSNQNSPSGYSLSLSRKRAMSQIQPQIQTQIHKIRI